MSPGLGCARPNACMLCRAFRIRELGKGCFKVIWSPMTGQIGSIFLSSGFFGWFLLHVFSRYGLELVGSPLRCALRYMSCACLRLLADIIAISHIGLLRPVDSSSSAWGS